MEDLITHADVLFDERPPPSAPPTTLSHPLPPPPPSERPVSQLYGSSYTQVATVPLRHRKSDSRGSQDFTPQLPPRPSNSIHPSRRAANQSSRTIGVETEDTETINSQRRSSASRSDETGPITLPGVPAVASPPSPVAKHTAEVQILPSNIHSDERDDSSATGEFTTPPATPGSSSGFPKSPQQSQKSLNDPSGSSGKSLEQ